MMSMPEVTSIRYAHILVEVGNWIREVLLLILSETAVAQHFDTRCVFLQCPLLKASFFPSILYSQVIGKIGLK